MGEVVEYPSSRIIKSNEKSKAKTVHGNQKTAQVLLFTGVQYERYPVPKRRKFKRAAGIRDDA